MSAFERGYRILLIAYPRSYRAAYGDAMAHLVRDRLRDAGGTRTVLLCGQIVADLMRTAAAERMEMTTGMLKRGWWRVAAGVIAPVIAFLGIGNMVRANDGGPASGRIAAAAFAVALAVVIYAGLALSRTRPLGDVLIGLGVLPGTVLVLFFWVPPVALVGVLCLVVAVSALVSAATRRTHPAA